MEGISDSEPGQPGRTVIAFDRPPFGLTERPLTWEGGADADPYTCKGGLSLSCYRLYMPALQCIKEFTRLALHVALR